MDIALGETSLDGRKVSRSGEGTVGEPGWVGYNFALTYAENCLIAQVLFIGEVWYDLDEGCKLAFSYDLNEIRLLILLDLLESWLFFWFLRVANLVSIMDSEPLWTGD